jgi:beta-xylosidase
MTPENRKKIEKFFDKHLKREAASVAPLMQAKPLLIGDWADPSILKDGDDYYMTHSSIDYQPGLLVWHSKDLRTWRPVCRATVNQDGSIWAPDLIKYNGRYYIYYPAAGTNWVTAADSPQGPWSPPQSIGVGKIDPGHVADDDGIRYIYLAGGYVVRMSADGLRAVTRPTKVYDGWPIPADWAVECFCLESPKLTRHDGWYYLTCAQGGTAGPSTSHMVVSARSRGPLGPWENSPHNPIIRTWSRDEAWWSKGHGTLVEGPGGQWYCVLHAWMNGYPTLGRCTLIEPIQWTDDGWFKAAERWPDGWEKPVKVEMPMSDDFHGERLGIQWQFFRQYDPQRFRLGKSGLTLKSVGADPGNSLPLCVMPLDRAYQIETEVEVEGGASGGLMLFFSPQAYIGLSISEDGVLRRVQMAVQRYDGTQEPRIGRRRVALRIVNDKQDVRFYYRDDAGAWQILQPSQDISGANHNAIGGWHAVRPALFAYGQGQAHFRYFRYRAMDD